MKNALLVINMILLCLVGYLYYLHFSNKKETVSAKKTTAVHAADDKVPGKIAYIDLDSLQNNYSYYKKIKADFEKKQSSANDEITSLQKNYQSRAAQLQEKAAGMTPQEQEKAMNEMNQMQQNFAARKQAIDNELYDYNTKMKDEILSRIENFLKDYNKDGQYAYIFSYEPGFMFYKDSALDITPDVIDGLNKLEEAKK